MSLRETTKIGRPVRGHHDIGGLLARSLDMDDTEPLPWQKLQMAIVAVLGSHDVIIIDEVRRSLEELPGQLYGRPYYERWAEALCNLLAEKGVVSRDDVEQRIREIRERLATGA